MYLLYADESNLDAATTEFFVYGGIAVPTSNASTLSQNIEELRTEAKVPRDFQLKFNPAPPKTDHADFAALKQAIVEAAIESECVLLANLILHKIAGDPDEARRTSINTVSYHFNCFLHRADQYGLVLIDQFTDHQIAPQLRERFAIGLTGMPYSKELRLDKILGFHYSAIGQAHFTSLIDIVIGSFRYAVNSFSTQRREDSARLIFSLLSPLFYRAKDDRRVDTIGLQFNPVAVKARQYRDRYQELKDFFGECGIEMAQEITSQRLV